MGKWEMLLAKVTKKLPKNFLPFFSPHHLIYHSGITLNQFYNLCADIFFHIIWNRNSIISLQIHLNCCINSLQKTFLVNPCKNKAGFIKCLRAFCRCSDTYRWKWMSNRSKETALFRQCS